MSKLWLAAPMLSLLWNGVAPAQTASAELSDPTTLFNTVCMGDRVKLSKSAFQSVTYGNLPRGAKEALGFALPKGGMPGVTPPFSLASADVPNTILTSIPKKAVFLLLPAAEGTSGRAASQCAVIWRGNHYADALKVAQTVVPLPNPKPAPVLGSGIRGLSYLVLQGHGAVVGAVELNRWTVLRVAPDLSPPQEQTVP